MNVLFLDQFSDLGGAQQCLLDLMPAVQQAGWNARVAVPGSGPLISRLREIGVPVDSMSCAPYSSGQKSLRDAWRFCSEIRSLTRATEELASNSGAHLLYVNGPRLLPAVARAARGRWPVVFHCHNHLSQPAAWLVGRALRSSQATVIACCRYAAQPLASYFVPSDLHLVENGVANPLLPLRRTGTDPIQIGMLGRISPEKGQAEFLRAARLLSRVLPRCRFRIAGEPLFQDPDAAAYRRSLDDLAAGLPVEFVGWHDNAFEFLAGLDLLVVPSMREPGAPRVILEAFAAGVPVVAFPTGGIPEIVVDGEDGFLVSPSTPAALAERILVLLLRQPHLLQTAAQAARQAWSRRFTLERYRRRILAIMAETATRNGTPEKLIAAGHAS